MRRSNCRDDEELQDSLALSKTKTRAALTYSPSTSSEVFKGPRGKKNLVEAYKPERSLTLSWSLGLAAYNFPGWTAEYRLKTNPQREPWLVIIY